MDSGPATNTRTLDVTLRETIQRLSRARQTPAIRKLLAEARHYCTILGSWTSAPPPPLQQNTTIDEVLDLLKRAMLVPLQREEADDDSPEISVEEVDEGETAGDSEPPPSRPTAIARVPLRRQLAPAAIRGPAAARSEAGEGISILRPERSPWRPVTGFPGVTVKHLVPGARVADRRALVRLSPGTELSSHVHAEPELLWVLSGALTLGDARIRPGEVIVFESGANSAALRSLGQCTALLVGSDRAELRAPLEDPPPPLP
jgi:hypothetical protein